MRKLEAIALSSKEVAGMAINPDELVALVRKEIFLYRRLLEEQKNQIRPLIANDPGRARQHGVRQRITVGKIKKLENRLRQLLQGEALVSAARNLGHPHGTVLMSLIEQFQMVIREICLVNLRNEGFIRSSYWGAESVLSQIFSGPSTYDSGGRSSSAKTGVLGRAFSF